MEKRTSYVINSAGRITRVRPSEVAHILSKNPEIRRCTQAEIDAFNGAKVEDFEQSASGDEKDPQPDEALTVAAQITNLCEAMKKKDMLDVIEAFDLPAPPANATKDGLAAIILDQENGYETAMSYAKAQDAA